MGEKQRECRESRMSLSHERTVDYRESAARKVSIGNENPQNREYECENTSARSHGARERRD